MKTLNFTTSTFDQDNTFTFEYKRYNGKTGRGTGYLFLDESQDQIYLMQHSVCLKAHYTEKDREEQDRLNSMEPVRDGDVVMVEGKQYRVKILGDYSDAGRLFLTVGDE